MKKFVNSSILLDRSESEQGKALMKKIQTDITWFAQNFNDTPQLESGWGHHYFCDEDGAFLQYDRNKPKVHECPTCKKKFTDTRYNNAWHYIYRYEAVMSVYEAAVLYTLQKNTTYIEHIIKILDFYAENYEQFVPHGEASGQGKITPQMLDESVFIVRALCACMLVINDLPALFMTKVLNKLFLPAAYFVDEQKKTIHNISCWINACVAGVGFLAQDKVLIDSALYGQYGMEQQVQQGVTSDNFWFEGSIHYNFYTIEALLHTALFAKNYGVTLSIKVTDVLYNMMIAPCKLAFNDTSLPNPNDGWPHIGLKTYSYLYELAANYFEDARLIGVLEKIYAASLENTPLPLGGPLTVGDFSLEWLLFGTQATTQESDLFTTSNNFIQSNYAMLRHENIEVFMKYGHRGPSHAHPDKMTIEVQAYKTPITVDLSNCGYAAYLCNAYYRRSYAHNTVVVDGEDHKTTHTGECLLWQEGKTIKTISHNAYDGVDFIREIQMLSNGFVDIFEVKSEKVHLYEWFFHVQGEVVSNLSKMQEVSSAYEGIWGCVQLSPSDEIVLEWKIGGISATQKIVASNLEVIIGKSYDLPSTLNRTTIILRCKENKIRFVQKWEFEKTQK